MATFTVGPDGKLLMDGKPIDNLWGSLGRNVTDVSTGDVGYWGNQPGAYDPRFYEQYDTGGSEGSSNVGYRLRPEAQQQLGGQIQLMKPGAGGYGEAMDPSQLTWDDQFGVLTKPTNIKEPDPGNLLERNPWMLALPAAYGALSAGGAFGGGPGGGAFEGAVAGGEVGSGAGAFGGASAGGSIGSAFEGAVAGGEVGNSLFGSIGSAIAKNPLMAAQLGIGAAGLLGGGASGSGGSNDIGGSVTPFQIDMGGQYSPNQITQQQLGQSDEFFAGLGGGNMYQNGYNPFNGLGNYGGFGMGGQSQGMGQSPFGGGFGAGMGGGFGQQKPMSMQQQPWQNPSPMGGQQQFQQRPMAFGDPMPGGTGTGPGYLNPPQQYNVPPMNGAPGFSAGGPEPRQPPTYNPPPTITPGSPAQGVHPNIAAMQRLGISRQPSAAMNDPYLDQSAKNSSIGDGFSGARDGFLYAGGQRLMPQTGSAAQDQATLYQFGYRSPEATAAYQAAQGGGGPFTGGQQNYPAPGGMGNMSGFNLDQLRGLLGGFRR